MSILKILQGMALVASTLYFSKMLLQDDTQLKIEQLPLEVRGEIEQLRQQLEKLLDKKVTPKQAVTYLREYLKAQGATQ